MKKAKNPHNSRKLVEGRAHAAEQSRNVYDKAKDTAENLMDNGQITPEE